MYLNFCTLLPSIDQNLKEANINATLRPNLANFYLHMYFLGDSSLFIAFDIKKRIKLNTIYPLIKTNINDFATRY